MKSTCDMSVLHKNCQLNGMVVIIYLIVLSAVDAALPRLTSGASFRRPLPIRGGGSETKPVILVVGSLNAGLILVGTYHQLRFV